MIQFLFYLRDQMMGVFHGEPGKVHTSQWAWSKRHAGFRFKYLCLDPEGYVWPERCAYIAYAAEGMAKQAGAHIIDADTLNYELLIGGNYTQLRDLLFLVEDVASGKVASS